MGFYDQWGKVPRDAIQLSDLIARTKAAGLRVKFVNAIHDSYDFEVHEDDRDKFMALLSGVRV